jgi:hypothetical protein
MPTIVSSGWSWPIWRWTAASPRHRRRWGESGKKPGGQRQRRRQTLCGGGRERHPSGDHHCPGQSSRLAAFGSDPRHLEDARRVAGSSVHLDCAYDSSTTRPPLAVDWRLVGWSVRSPRRASLLRSKPVCGGSWSARIRGTTPTRSWCTERRGRVSDFWVAFSDVEIIVRRLIREGWSRYRWEGRPSPTTMTN